VLDQPRISAQQLPFEYAPVEALIDRNRNAGMFVLADQAGAASIGEVVLPAQMVTPNAINFMARYARGLIRLALTKARATQLNLAMMKNRDEPTGAHAFTVSIEARTGVSTGISAADRARTIAVAVDAMNGPDALVSPGHVFPVIVEDGGVLVRAGAAEAAVDLARLAGLVPASVICQIMNDRGAVATLDELHAFAGRHDLMIGSVTDLIAFRRRHERLVECASEELFQSSYGGDWRIATFRNRIDGSECYVLRMGEIAVDRPTLVRVHNSSVFDDLLGRPGPRQHALQRAMISIGRHGSGLIVIFPFPRSQSASFQHPEPGVDRDGDYQTFGIGAQVLAELGVNEMILLTDSPPRSMAGLEAFQLKVVGTHPLGASSPTIEGDDHV
jgi:3,4-dihydroxy 2-butanone 4-phosphate synthase / GTP cyclohydrolase II